MREYILIEKSYQKSSTTRPLRLIHFSYLALSGVYFYTSYLPGTYFGIESSLSPLPGIYFYTPYLPGTYCAIESC